MMKYSAKQKGFTALEVTIAMGIVAVSLIGLASLVIINQQAKNESENYIVASMLAQEGLELVRNLRDENWLTMQSDDWRNVDWDDSIIGDGSFILDHRGRDNIDDGPDDIGEDDARLYLVDGFYEHESSGTSTNFSRIINTAKAADHIITASSTVMWQEGGRIKIYVAETYFYNWR